MTVGEGGEGDYRHLRGHAKRLAALSDDERILRLADEHFILHASAQQVLGELEFMFKTKNAERPQGRMLLAPTLHGKTSLLAHFEALHEANDNFGGDAAIVPVVRVQYPPVAQEGVFAVVLDKLGVPYPATANQKRLRRDCIDRLRQVQSQILLIDEFHHILNGSPAQRQQGLDSIKYLYNEFGRPMVIAGTKDVYDAVCGSDQILSRFRPMTLPRFTTPDDREFIRLLVNFEALTPLRRPSNLEGDDIRLQIHRMTHGTIGNIADLILVMGTRAIQSREERITLEALREADWKAKADPDTVKEVR